MAGNFCTNCGEALRTHDQKFCAMCGQPTISSPEEVNPNKESTSLDLLELKFAGQEFDGFSEGAFTFRNANVLLVGANSQNWFPGEYTSSEVISKHCEGETPEWISDYTINKWFLDGEEFFENYEAILWKDSQFGERFLKALTARGAHVAHGYLGRTAQFDGPDGKVHEIELSTPIDIYSGRWALSDGTEYAQKGQVFKSKVDGSEIVYWHIDALANTRPSIQPLSSKYSHRILIPHFLQVATYLAETPFPSAIGGSMGLANRETTIGDEVTHVLRPATRFLKDSYLLGLQKTDSGDIALGCWAPEIYQQGYVFTDEMNDQELFAAIPIACDGLPKIAEIIVDGYANWPVDSELDFQIVLLSDLATCNEDECYSYGATVPGISYGKMFFKANYLYDTNYAKLHESIAKGNSSSVHTCLINLKEIADEGVGSIFLHAANSFAASALELGLDWEFDQMLLDFSKIDVDSQGLNALSNLVVSKIRKNQFQVANELVDLALGMCSRKGPNLETISHFCPWDGSAEIPIITEVYESAIRIKRKLRLDIQMQSIAREIVKYCSEKNLEIDIFREAQSILENS